MTSTLGIKARVDPLALSRLFEREVINVVVMLQVNDYNCTCVSGWTGPHCETGNI